MQFQYNENQDLLKKNLLTLIQVIFRESLPKILESKLDQATNKLNYLISAGALHCMTLFTQNHFRSPQLTKLTVKAKRVTISCILALIAVGSFKNVAHAEAKNVPTELKNAIADIEVAANEKNLNKIIGYYDPSFTNNDGFNANSIKTALTKIWEQYPNLKYSTQINSWEKLKGELVAETTTTISGIQNSQGRQIKLESVLKSRQYFRNQKLVRQDIISEKTKVFSGDNPPQVTVNLPETVKVGEKYNFDTIVTEPLAGNILLGAALEERTASNRYLKPSTLDLEPLSSGGIFKVVTAPRLSDNHWLSAIIVRGDGITMVTHRVNIEK